MKTECGSLQRIILGYENFSIVITNSAPSRINIFKLSHFVLHPLCTSVKQTLCSPTAID